MLDRSDSLIFGCITAHLILTMEASYNAGSQASRDSWLYGVSGTRALDVCRQHADKLVLSPFPLTLELPTLPCSPGSLALPA